MINKKSTFFVSFGLALILSQLFFVTAFAAEQPLKVVIADLKGEVKMVQAGKPQSVPASKGMEINPNDTIKMGKGGWAKIGVENTGEIELEGETTWFYSRSVTEEEKHAFHAELAIGRLKAKVKKLPEGSNFEIKTPVSIAGVRGTLFNLFVYAVQNQIFAMLEVLENSVAYSNLKGDQKMIVNEGQKATADESGKITEGGEAPKQEKQENKGDDGSSGGGSSGDETKDPFDGFPPGVDNFMGRTASTKPSEPIVYSNPAQTAGSSQPPSSSSHSGSGHYHDE